MGPFPEEKDIPDKKGANYYPFGLLMSGISDKALKQNYAQNKYRFNGGNELQNQEFSDGSGLEAYDAENRMYDPQLGRFWQIDPLADINETSSPYSFADNNPILLNDPMGLLSDSSHPQVLATATVTHAFNPLPSTPTSVNTGLADVGAQGGDPATSADAAPGTAAAPIGSFGFKSGGDETASQDQGGHNIVGDIAYEINRFNPLAQVVNLGYTFFTGHDSYGVKQNTPQALVNLAATIPAGRLSSTIVNVTADIGLAEVRQGIASTFANANNFSHIMASKHGLDVLLPKAGSEANVIRRLYLSLGQTGSLPASGVFVKVVNIYGYDVTIRGAVVNGIPRIGTAFIP